VAAVTVRSSLSKVVQCQCVICPGGMALRTDAPRAASRSVAGDSPPPTPVPFYVQERPKSLTHQVLRLALMIWLVAYPIVSCGPVIGGAAAGGTTGSITALTGLMVGGLLWWPWIVGIMVLGLLALLTR
jgi:hypothetical protein